jgi:hypothetical protein
VGRGSAPRLVTLNESSVYGLLLAAHPPNGLSLLLLGRSERVAKSRAYLLCDAGLADEGLCCRDRLLGLIAFFYPGMTAFVLLYVISFRAILTALLRIVLAILAALPGPGLLSLVWLADIYWLILGIALIVLGFEVRGSRSTDGGDLNPGRVIRGLLARPIRKSYPPVGQPLPLSTALSSSSSR